MVKRAGRGEVAHFSLDPCVQTTDLTAAAAARAEPTLGAPVAAPKVCFTPPLEPFSLCKYEITGVSEMPLRGFYQMKVTLAFPTLFRLVSLVFHFLIFISLLFLLQDKLTSSF